ncbi:MAG: undecaprenyl-diphosphate phosphatase [Rikenellaceae bacterium]|nr:undecaprenyl-diphosphate phosphatase [Rikenellaceae bacterium]
MTVIESMVLGLVQGLTEFLPVSSSGHLQIAKALLGVEIQENLTFDVTLHVATVLSTLVVLRREVGELLRGVLKFQMNDQTRYMLKILLSMIPIGIVGFCLKDQINEMLNSEAILVIVGAMLLLTAALLTFATYAKPRVKENISYRDAFIIGLGQALAAMPGLSRSGTTIATGLLLGNRKESVAHFSFLMVIIPILGEAFLEIVGGELSMSGEIGVWPLVAGFVTAFAAGAFACRFMIEIVKRSKLVWFAVYCAVVGSVAIISYIV